MDYLKLIEQSESFSQLLEAVEQGRAAAFFGAHNIHRAVYAAALARACRRPVLVVTETDAEAARLAADLEVITGRAAAFPSRELVFIEVEGISRDAETERLSVLGRAAAGKLSVITCSAEAYCSFTMPKSRYKGLTLELHMGDKASISQLTATLLDAGYTRATLCEGRGTFSIRGGIVDIFPCDRPEPIRIEFWGDDISSIVRFAPDTQRRIAAVKSARITPAREVVLGEPQSVAELLATLAKRTRSEHQRELFERDLENLKNGLMPVARDRYMPFLYKEPATILDYLPESPVMFCEPPALRERIRTRFEQLRGELLALVEREEPVARLERYYAPFSLSPPGRGVVLADVFARSSGDIPLAAAININASPLPRWDGDVAALADELRAYCSQGYAAVMLAPTDRAADSLCRDLTDRGLTALRPQKDSQPAYGQISVDIGTLSSGFDIPQLKFALFTGQRSGAVQKKEQVRRKSAQNAFNSLEDLVVGDYVVHSSHGIGQFDGIHRIDHHGMVRDYIKIKYRGEDTLYVPVTQLDLVSPYIAPGDDGRVQLAKLHSGEWQKTKQQVYRSVREMAGELISLYSKREQAEGIAFSEDGDWQREFETRFIYEETDDQLRSAMEIKRDMCRGRPMDRLLCGDVGVGKTEVALRGVFKCVNDGYQCAVLVPTTILAWQHFGTFMERLAPYPIKVAMLSRFTTAKQMREAIAGIKNGRVDVVIGTHRLLQKDVEFKRLGLLVIDEEQRFGVAHKEKLKQKFPGVDVLTLSATPIPRTLNMAMSGIRDMSVIEQPPEDRSPVMTYVIEYDERIVDDAIRRELARGGQVYYLHNRVESIDRVAGELMLRFPDAAIETAHGKLSEEQLSGVWRRVMNDECDILVCTTIIETGIDVPNCNTLIVENADRLGLSQLYQIRGRVGRSSRRAFAYFTFRRDSVPSEIASKRLSAIRDFTSFGSGFKIAMRDLQIRGAGSVLSARQSGHMAAVGYETYLKILEQAVSDERGEPRKPIAHECLIDLPVNACIPDSYIAETAVRIGMYKRIAAIENQADADDVLDELRDRFGEPPAEARSLVLVSLARRSASALGFTEVSVTSGRLYLYCGEIDMEAVKRVITAEWKLKIMVAAKGRQNISAQLASGSDPLEVLGRVLTAYRG